MGYLDDPTFAPPGAGLPQPVGRNLPSAFDIPLPGEQTAGGAPDWLQARPPAADPAMLPGPLPASMGAGSGGIGWGGLLPGEQPTTMPEGGWGAAGSAPPYLLRPQPITPLPPPGGWPLPSELPKAAPERRPVVPGGTGGGGNVAAKPAGPSPTEQAYDAEGRAIDDATKAQVAKDQAQAQHDSDQAQAEANVVARAQEHRQAVGDEFMKRMAVIEKANDDLAAQHPDPNRLWNNLGNGEKLMGGLAMALHGIGNAFLGTNTQDPISRAIDRDIQLQREAIENKKQGLANKTNFVKMYRDAGLNDAEADAHAKLQVIQLLEKRIDDTLQGAKNQSMIAEGAKAKAKLQEEKLKAMDDAKFRTLQQAGMAADTRLKNMQAAAANSKAAGMDPKMLVKLPDGRMFSAPTEKDAELIRNQIAQGKSFKETLDQIAKTSPGVVDQLLNFVGYTTPTMAQFNGLAQSAVDKFRPATSGSTAEMGDPSQRALRASFAPAPSESAAAYAERLRRMGQQADVGLNSTLSAIGQQPIINAVPRR